MSIASLRTQLRQELRLNYRRRAMLGAFVFLDVALLIGLLLEKSMVEFVW